MTEPDGMDEVRERLRRAEDDARAARYLAGGADRDTAELRAEVREFRAETRTEFANVRAEMRTEFANVRAEMRTEFADVRSEMRTFRDQNNRVLSAMRADLTDLRTDLTDLRTGMDTFREHVDRNFLAVHSKIDGVAAGLRVITDLLTRAQRDDPPSP